MKSFAMAAVKVVFAVFVIMSFIQGDSSIPVQLSEYRGGSASAEMEINLLHFLSGWKK